MDREIHGRGLPTCLEKYEPGKNAWRGFDICKIEHLRKHEEKSSLLSYWQVNSLKCILSVRYRNSHQVRKSLLCTKYGRVKQSDHYRFGPPQFITPRMAFSSSSLTHFQITPATRRWIQARRKKRVFSYVRVISLITAGWRVCQAFAHENSLWGKKACA